MTTTTTGTDWAAHARRLADLLQERGDIRSPGWHAAIANVPRHVFVPHAYTQNPTGQWDGWNTAGHLDRVYSPETLVTALGTQDGHPVPISSSTKPDLMIRMLEVLDVHDGQRVLEIGTGTGYNAALLSHRLGDRQVSSIDVEPELVDLARARLAELGYHPTLQAGDGAAGLAQCAPFDRIIATCSVPCIPWPWVQQTALGGVILADVRVAVNAGNLVRLTRTGQEQAEGRFDARQASFMALRHEPGQFSKTPCTIRTDNAPVTERTTTRDPRTPWSCPVVWLLATFRIGSHYSVGYIGNGQSHPLTAVFLSTPDGSRCEVSLALDDDGTHVVKESGPVALWAEVEAAYEQWDSLGQPNWPRFGLTVTPTEQRIWIDKPDSSVSWSLQP